MYWQTQFSNRRYHENSTPPSFFSWFNVQTPFSFLPCFQITTWFNHFPFLSGFWKSKQHDAHILGLSLHLKNAWESNEIKMKTKLTFWRQQSMTALQASCSFSLTEYDSDINWNISSSVIFDQIVVQARMRNWSFSWRGCLKTSGQEDPLKSENVTWNSFHDVLFWKKYRDWIWNQQIQKEQHSYHLLSGQLFHLETRQPLNHSNSWEKCVICRWMLPQRMIRSSQKFDFACNLNRTCDSKNTSIVFV